MKTASTEYRHGISAVFYHVIRQEGEALTAVAANVGLCASAVRKVLNGEGTPRESSFLKYKEAYPALEQYVQYRTRGWPELTPKGRKLLEELKSMGPLPLYGDGRGIPQIGGTSPAMVMPIREIQVPVNSVVTPAAGLVVDAAVALVHVAHAAPLRELEKWVAALGSASDASMPLDKIVWCLRSVLKDRGSLASSRRS